jgi:hypothetical protein
MDNETDTENLRTAREFLSNTGRDDLAGRLDGKIEDRQEAIASIVQMRNLIQNSEKAGLSDDPAVEALREEADALAEEYGLKDEPDVTEKLAENHGLDASAVENIHEDDRDRLAEALESIEAIKNRSARLEGLTRKEIKARRDEIEKLLDHNNVSAAALIDADESADLRAALAEDQSVDIDEQPSDRVQAAELADTRDELEADIDDADSPVLELELMEELERIENKLDALDVDITA